MQGLMMDYPLTLDRILEHANRMYPRKQIVTKQVAGHEFDVGRLAKLPGLCSHDLANEIRVVDEIRRM